MFQLISMISHGMYTDMLAISEVEFALASAEDEKGICAAFGYSIIRMEVTLAYQMLVSYLGKMTGG